MDLLSRRNIGVLESASKPGSGEGVGAQLLIQAQSLGAVQVFSGQPQAPAAPDPLLEALALAPHSPQIAQNIEQNRESAPDVIPYSRAGEPPKAERTPAQQAASRSRSFGARAKRSLQKLKDAEEKKQRRIRILQGEDARIAALTKR